MFFYGWHTKIVLSFFLRSSSVHIFPFDPLIAILFSCRVVNHLNEKTVVQHFHLSLFQPLPLSLLMVLISIFIGITLWGVPPQICRLESISPPLHPPHPGKRALPSFVAGGAALTMKAFSDCFSTFCLTR